MTDHGTRIPKVIEPDPEWLAWVCKATELRADIVTAVLALDPGPGGLASSVETIDVLAARKAYLEHLKHEPLDDLAVGRILKAIADLPSDG